MIASDFKPVSVNAVLKVRDELAQICNHMETAADYEEKHDELVAANDLRHYMNRIKHQLAILENTLAVRTSAI